MATQTIDATLFASSHPDIAKRTSVSKLLISLVMVLAGIFAFLSVFELNDKSSAVGMGLMVLGMTLFLLGVFRLCLKSKEIVYLPTGSVAKEHSLFFDLKHLDRLAAIVENGHPDNVPGIRCESSGNVRLDILMAQDNRFVALQLFQFVPYTYAPVTAVYYFTGSEAASVSAFLAKCKAA